MVDWATSGPLVAGWLVGHFLGDRGLIRGHHESVEGDSFLHTPRIYGDHGLNFNLGN